MIVKFRYIGLLHMLDVLNMLDILNVSYYSLKMNILMHEGLPTNLSTFYSWLTLYPHIRVGVYYPRTEVGGYYLRNEVGKYYLHTRIGWYYSQTQFL